MVAYLLFQTIETYASGTVHETKTLFWTRWFWSSLDGLLSTMKMERETTMLKINFSKVQLSSESIRSFMISEVWRMIYPKNYHWVHIVFFSITALIDSGMGIVQRAPLSLVDTTCSKIVNKLSKEEDKG